MRRHIIDRVSLELTQGDIVAQPDVDAVVNAANAELLPGGGVAGAIHRAAGPGLADECRPYAPIRPGQAVLTSGHRLPNAYVIHCLGPVYGVDEPSDELLGDCYRSALLIADRHALDSIAFPAISTGAFGYPMADAARIALRAVADATAALSSVSRIRLVLFDTGALRAHEDAMEAIYRRSE